MRRSFIRRSGLSVGLVVIGLLFGMAGRMGVAQAQGGVIFVAPGGSGTQDGQSWANAKDLQAALTGATSGAQLWVKAGTYKPTTGADRTLSFTLKTGVALYGGFAGTETTLGQRNIAANVTRLSGDLSGNDNSNNFDNHAENSYNVVRGGGTDTTARLDGFTISGGNAEDNGINEDITGGGINNLDSNPTLVNLVVTRNTASTGGGIYTGRGYNFEFDSALVLNNITISGNYAVFGGGFASDRASGLTNVTIIGNSAEVGGGGIYNTTPLDESLTVSNSTVAGNTAGGGASAIYNYADATMHLQNVVISGNKVFGNQGVDGDTILNEYESSLTMDNVTLAGNAGTASSQSIANVESSTIVVRNSILWNDESVFLYQDDTSSMDVQYSTIKGGYAGVGNINADPRFVQTVPSSRPSTGGNLRLRTDSPARNAGNNSLIPAGVTTDRDGGPRITDSIVDMGAYESLRLQTITFAPIAAKPATAAPFTVSATASSGLPLTFSASGLCTVSGSTVTLTGSGGGTCTITATQAGDATYDPATASLTFMVNKVATTTTLVSSPNPTSQGKNVILTATVAASGSTPDGTVTFYDGATTLGTRTLAGGKATLETTSLSVDLHSLTAAYNVHPKYVKSTSAAVSQRVRATTTTALVSSLNPSRYGQAVTFNATVTSSSGTPDGSVTFLDGTTVLGSGTLNAGKASLTLSTLGVGSHAITARYDGATAFAGSGSAALSQVIQRATTTTVLTASLNPSKAGQSVTFTARVTAGAGAQTSGTVTFKDGATTLGTATIVDRTASFSTASLSAGVHTITAVYSGDATYKESQGSLSQRVRGVTTTALTSSLNPATVGQAVTFSASVASTNTATLGVPTGTITFKDGSVTIATVPLNANGRANFTTLDLSKGTHSITAVYSGSTPYAPSTSAVLTQTVK